jgi:hypothetical protein
MPASLEKTKSNATTSLNRLNSALVPNTFNVTIPQGCCHQCCGRQIKPHDIVVTILADSITVITRCPVHFIDGLQIELPMHLARAEDEE